MFDNLTKDNVYFYLVNDGKKRWLDSRFFYNALVERCDFNNANDLQKLKSFQRALASIIQEINTDQTTYKKFVIVSCDDGYKIPLTEEEFRRGYNYIYSKIDEPLQRMRFIDEMRRKFIYGSDVEQTEEDIFSRVI